MRMAGNGIKSLLLVCFILFILAAWYILAFRSDITGSEFSDRSLLSLSGQTMGAQYQILLHSTSLQDFSARLLLESGIKSRLHYLDKTLFSTYEPGSQLSQLNEAEIREAVLVSPEFAEVFKVALDVFEKSSGAFDATIKSLVDLWGFGALTSVQEIPEQTAIAQAREQMGMRAVLLTEEREVFLAHKTRQVSLDFSAIAKGYAIDQIAILLDGLGQRNFLVAIGGEVLSKGVRPDNTNWRIGIEKPVAESSELFQQLRINGDKLAIASSGNYQNYFIHDGQRYSHIINPITGWPVSHDLISVTVVESSAMSADAWATTLFVLGPEEGMTLANDLKLAAFFIVDSADGFDAAHSEAFKRFL